MLALIKIDSDLMISESISNATIVIEQHNSENSKRAYAGDLSHWECWCKYNSFPTFDSLGKEHIITFIMDHVEKHKISTIERRLASLSRYLQLRRLYNPCYDKDILILIRKLKEKHGSTKSWGKAITLDVLNNMLKTCDDGIIGTRDAALLLFGFSTGGRRRSEISSAVVENLTKNRDGNFVYNLSKSKTNKTGQYDPKPLIGRSSSSLIDWLDQSQISEGCIFRSVNVKGKIGGQLSCVDINRIVKKRCDKSGYDPTEYTAHSLRSGFVTESGKRGKPLGDVMAMTGHKSISEVMRYYKTGDIMNNSAASLAG